ncbi:MAG: parvulin peptidyl-prolyl isomerase [Alphaproteobacteria bacterium]|nr:parvulin peptidyl-prolyl isomerase [Alphaproteobacteria bacterium]
MGNQIRASHILLMHEDSAGGGMERGRMDALAEIQDLRKKILAGGDFADLAAEFSDCPSGQDGGDLGHFGKGAMVPEFEKAAFALDVGKLSDVIETEFGYHLIVRTE